MLVNHNVSRALEWTDHAEHYHHSPKTIFNSTLRHRLFTQHAVCARSSLQLPFDFVSDRFLADIKRRNRPDCVIQMGDHSLAVEAELTRKNKPRIYMAYLNHIEAMREQHYQRVEYVFPRQVLTDSYKRLFDEAVWPKYRYSDSSRIVPDKRNNEHVHASVPDSVRERFAFTTLEVPSLATWI